MFNYNEAVKADVMEYIRDNYSAEEIAEKLEDRDVFAEELDNMLWIEDSVTGNGSGSYTFSTYKAKEFVFADTETVQDALKEFCVDAETIAEKFLSEDWEYFDVTARCYCLSGAIYEALEEIAA
jgi:hypothetical protein